MLYQSTDLFRPYLLSGERILWTGQPKQGLTLGKRDAILIPFSLMWCGFIIFWNIDVWSAPKTGTPDDWFFELWGLPFLAFGLYLVLGRFLHDAWIRKNLVYAVTDRRILFRRGTRITSRDIKSLPMLEFSERRDGTGTIVFDSEDLGYSLLMKRNTFGDYTLSSDANRQFFRVEDARRVYGIIRNHAYT